jgi:hypothetical protein
MYATNVFGIGYVTCHSLGHKISTQINPAIFT